MGILATPLHVQAPPCVGDELITGSRQYGHSMASSIKQENEK